MRRGEPRAHWVVLAVLMTLMALSLLLSGFTTGQVGEGAHAPASRPGSGTVPDAFRGGGPIVDPAQPEAAGFAVPDRHVVLTFDDGPTVWTEKILDLLAARGVKATFFVVGANAADRPDLVTRMRAEGHEVGVHTFTHTNLANVSQRRFHRELDLTQLTIAAATRQTTGLLRMPYSSTTQSVTAAEWQAMQAAENYRVVFTDLDTKDWEKPGAPAIVRAGVPQGGRGAVVMLHDGGGDRSQTVAALDVLIAELQQRGYTFDTISSTVGAPSPWHPATTSERVQGSLLSASVRASERLVTLLKWVLLVLAVLAIVRTLALVVLARRHSRQSPIATTARRARAPSVSVIVPAYNEELGITGTVRSVAATGYPDLEIIVVDDGSTDATADVVAGLALPNVRLIRQANAGKPGALNTGIRASQHDIVVLVDGDTVFESEAISALMAPFAAPEVGAVSGNTKVGNRRGLLGRWQHIEYVSGFNLDRRMFDVLECMPTVPGAIGAFRREAIESVGGLSDDTLAEDTDLTMAICRAGWRVVFAPTARAWTEAPATLGQLWKQRYRWCYGTMQSMWKHRGAALQRGAAGKLGRRGLPYLLVFQVLFPLLAPVIDIVTVYAILVTSSLSALWVWLGFAALQMLSATYAFHLDGERLRPLWSLPLQQVVYRQLMYLVGIQSVANALYGLQLRWQALRRTGEMDAVPVTAGSGLVAAPVTTVRSPPVRR